MTDQPTATSTRRQTLTGAAAAGAALLGAGTVASAAGIRQDSAANNGPTKLFSLWTSGDPDIAHRVALMYTHAAKQAGWFEDVKLVVWGPSQRILVGDKDLKAKIKAMRDDGVVVEACVACARSFGLVEQLEALGLPVLGQGGPLSEAMKDPATSVSFF